MKYNLLSDRVVYTMSNEAPHPSRNFDGFRSGFNARLPNQCTE